ncbi:Protein of unknown function [Solimonas aquatica]|uniref:Uncharacterized protein n=1 Tax=Solimonas aquatica TaxID=489703 RepID=A0A1H9A4N8_9GAMM|nr:Protein of unknown function [Solimonas aquatica]
MHLKRYDKFYSRRKFLSEAALGTLSAGVLMPMWDAIAATGDVSKAYPDELLSIEMYSKGRIKPGDRIDASNVEHVKDLLDPIRYEQVSKQGRVLSVAPTTTDIMRLSPWQYVEATLANQGKARFDPRGNVVTADGQPWLGGNPFPDAKSGLELMATQTLSWGRHDASFYAIKTYEVDPAGKVQYQYTGGWAELMTVARLTMDPKPYWPEHKDKLRFQSVFFVSPLSVAAPRF